MTESESETECAVVSAVPVEIGRRHLILAVAFVSPFLAMHIYYAGLHAWPMLALFCSFPIMIALLMYLRRKQVALTLSAHDMELKQPWWWTVRIAYAKITRVVASSILDGGCQPITKLEVYSRSRRITVRPDLLARSGIIDRLRRLPGFDYQAYVHCEAEEDALFSKRTELFRRADQGMRVPPTRR